MSSWNASWWRGLFIPSGALFVLSVGLFSFGLFRVPSTTLSFCYAAIFLAGLILSWRFHSGRNFSGLLLLLLAHRAVGFFAGGHLAMAGPGRTALDAVSFFLALDFIWLAAAGEFGFSIAAFAPRLGVLFLESVFVAVICRPTPAWGSDLFQVALLPRPWFHWTRLSQLPWLTLAFAFVFLVARFAKSRRQIDSASAWAAAAVACAFSTGTLGYTADGFIASAGLVLLVAVIETSYRMAYHDELTGIPSRRAFNDARTGLESPYCVAVVDVDHFKQFNDTYGHDTGDEVLRMVARRLDEVTGGGKAYRVGGEEFTVIFPRLRAKDALPHLEQLRLAIDGSAFRLRGHDRRAVARGPERRNLPRTRQIPDKPRHLPDSFDLRVTVSIGVAEAREGDTFDAVLERADRTLYRAKQNGRNRTEVAEGRGPGELQPPRKKKSAARSS